MELHAGSPAGDTAREHGRRRRRRRPAAADAGQAALIEKLPIRPVAPGEAAPAAAPAPGKPPAEAEPAASPTERPRRASPFLAVAGRIEQDRAEAEAAPRPEFEEDVLEEASAGLEAGEGALADAAAGPEVPGRRRRRRRRRGRGRATEPGASEGAALPAAIAAMDEPALPLEPLDDAFASADEAAPVTPAAGASALEGEGAELRLEQGPRRRRRRGGKPSALPEPETTVAVKPPAPAPPPATELRPATPAHPPQPASPALPKVAPRAAPKKSATGVTIAPDLSAMMAKPSNAADAE
ncbi:MAG: hypothetical protein EYC70_07910 [Planctomycetota bacterium]|nr:MAG: hypothetical protein EYC70_07910 [Planctomycetota bacterium]